MRRPIVLAGLALLLAATVALAQTRARGVIYSGTITGSGTQTSGTITTDSRTVALTLFVNSTRAGTVQVLRLDKNGSTHAQGSAQNVTANTEKVIAMAYPLRQFQVAFTNSSTNTATVQIEADDGQPKAGEHQYSSP